MRRNCTFFERKIRKTDARNNSYLKKVLFSKYKNHEYIA